MYSKDKQVIALMSLRKFCILNRVRVPGTYLDHIGFYMCSSDDVMILGLGSTMHEANMLFLINIWTDIDGKWQDGPVKVNSNKKYASHNRNQKPKSVKTL